MCVKGDVPTTLNTYKPDEILDIFKERSNPLQLSFAREKNSSWGPEVCEACEFALRLRKPSFGRLPTWKGALLPSAKQLHCWDCVPTAEAVLWRLYPHCWDCVPTAEAVSPLRRLWLTLCLQIESVMPMLTKSNLIYTNLIL